MWERVNNGPLNTTITREEIKGSIRLRVIEGVLYTILSPVALFENKENRLHQGQATWRWWLPDTRSQPFSKHWRMNTKIVHHTVTSHLIWKQGEPSTSRTGNEKQHEIRFLEIFECCIHCWHMLWLWRSILKYLTIFILKLRLEQRHLAKVFLRTHLYTRISLRIQQNMYI